jgi:membrane protein DedA with SNARE-associated domain
MELIRELGAILADFLARYGLLAIFAVMLFKELGVPVPVPSDLIMITAGVQAGLGDLGLPELTLAIWVAMLVGGSAQFLIARRAGREFVYRAGRLIGLTRERLEYAITRLRRRGPVGIFIGLNVPGARAGIIPAAGLLNLRYLTFVLTMMAGSSVFYGWHIALGYVAGPSATALLDRLHLPIGPIFLGLLVLGLIGWAFLRSRKRAKSGPESEAVDRLLSFTHAACPACLVATAIERLRSEKAP